MDSDREKLRRKLREKIHSKRSSRSDQMRCDTNNRAKMEEMAMALSGTDAQTLGVVMNALRDPRRVQELLKCVDDDDDDDEAPPPTTS